MTTETLRAPVRWAASWSPRRRTAGWIAFAFGYLLISYLLLRSILQTYVIADDFEAPFGQIMSGARSLSSTLSFAWHNSYVDGDRARTLGVVVGAVVNFLWIWVTKTLGLSILDVFALIRFAMILACALTAATLWWQAARTYLRPVRWSTALVLVSVALFGTLQLHGMWSNDPVESYPMAGYASAAIGFGVLALAVWATRRPTLLRFGVLTLAGLLGVSYYEFNLGAVLGAGLIAAAAAWPHRRTLRPLLTHLALAGMVVVVPVIWLLATGAANSGSNYNGRALQASGAIHSLLIGLVSGLPGAGWPRTASNLGGYPAVTLGSAVVAVVVVIAVGVWLRWGPRAPTIAAESSPKRSWLMLCSVAAAVAIYAVFAIALEGATQKVEIEVKGIGEVYTAYAVSSAAVALALAAGAWLLFSRRGRRLRWPKLAVAAIALAFLIFQGSYNEHLKSTLNINSAENQLLDSAFAGGTSKFERCNAIRTWISYPYPDYYRDGVFEGSELGYKTFYGQLFCPDLVAPADGFSPRWGPEAQPQWWLEANNGSIDLRTPNCDHGCSGTLHFSAGGFAIGHLLQLSTPGVEQRRLTVPDHFATFAVHVHLTGTYSAIGVRADGHGVTPASVHVGPLEIPLFIDFKNVRFSRS